MSHTRLLDVQTGFGGFARGQRQPVTAQDYLTVMSRLGIEQALARFAPDDVDVDVCLANRTLDHACEGCDRLHPCPVIVPDSGGDLPPVEEQVNAFIGNGAKAALIRPQHDYWELIPWVSDGLFDAMMARKLPLYCATPHVSLQQAGDIAGRFPELRIILAQVAYRTQRTIMPLLKAFPNISLSLGNNWTVHLGIEHMVGEVGAERLLFGTGFPEAEPMMAVTQLVYADISEEQKTMIGAGNLERLAEEVR